MTSSAEKKAAELRQMEPSLYAKHQKVYPREVHGLFAALRVTAVVVLLGLYYGVAWLQWDGRQLLLLDLPARKFYVLGWVFWPQDAFYLAVLLILAALTLFFFTALAGRLWCGYACPQTVWTEIFMWMERKIEGDRPQQMKLDKAPWTGRKFAVKGAKHAAWILFSLYTGFTFVGYFTPIRELWFHIAAGDLGMWATFWILFYGFATYGNAGWMREQVCIYMCPYARFQSAMFDQNTLVISYDSRRGEARGARKRDSDYQASGLGDCIDCTICVQVCPTGIDIRDGLQYECIACAACIDSCDDVMDRMGYPRGLIRYTTQNAVDGNPSKVLRPRILVYAAILAGIFAVFMWAVANRMPLDLDVIRDRNALYRENAEGLVENVYTLRIVNMDTAPHRYELSVDGIADVQLGMDLEAIELEQGSVSEFAVRVAADPEDLPRLSSEIRFTLQSLDDETMRVEKKARFLGPVRR